MELFSEAVWFNACADHTLGTVVFWSTTSKPDSRMFMVLPRSVSTINDLLRH